MLVKIGKLSSVKWETYAFVKGGALMGEYAGKLTSYTHEQMLKADEIAASFLGTDVGVLEPGAYSKLFLTELQMSFKWNSAKMMWATREDTIDRRIAINPKLKKIKTYDYFRSVPKLMQKLILGINDDLQFIFSTAKFPDKIMAIHGKLSAWNRFGHKENDTDVNSKSFKLFEIGPCRRAMLKFAEEDNEESKNMEIRLAKREHINECSKDGFSNFISLNLLIKIVCFSEPFENLYKVLCYIWTCNLWW